jgi:RimJ/RimL family protein N-acetyltransferase
MKFPDEVPTLSSGDVTLRAHRVEDADAIAEQCTDPVSIQWTTVPLGYTHEMAVEWVKSSIPRMWESDSEHIFAIETTHPDGVRRFSGSLSLRDEGSARAELAFGAHPAVRGRGVMTTAVNLLLDWGFAERNLQTVIWWANVGNIGSRRVAWKSGFTFGGTVRRWLDHRGDPCDAWVAALHRDDSRTPKNDWLDTPVIRGEHVTLRPFEESDIRGIVEGCRDPRARHWLAFLPTPYTEQDARDFLARCEERTSQGAGIWWAVADATSGAFLGNVSFPRMGRREAEIGYWSLPAARGRGVITEAVGLVVRHAFVDVVDGGLGMHRVFLKAAEGNVASQHVARANGFTECGRERQAEVLGDGSYADLVMFDLLSAEWHGG